jgi:hypothetical protein
MSQILYPELCHLARPGDVIVFTGKDIPSSVVKIATQSDYVHVAIVLAVLEEHPDGRILIAESHIDTSLPSIGTGECSQGAQIQWLEDRLKACKDPVRWSALRPPLNPAETAKLQTWLWEIEQNKTGYDFVQAIGAGIGGICNAPDFSTLFCSELVTYGLQLVGRVFSHVNPSKTTPVEVMAFSCLAPPIEIALPHVSRNLSNRNLSNRSK